MMQHISNPNKQHGLSKKIGLFIQVAAQLSNPSSAQPLYNPTRLQPATHLVKQQGDSINFLFIVFKILIKGFLVFPF